MDWIQAATAFAAAAGGVLTMTKALKTIETKRAAPEKERRALFLNGDKEEVIRQLQKLVQSDRDVNRTLLEIQSEQQRISRRLDRAGIPI